MILLKAGARELVESLDARAEMGRYLFEALSNEKTEEKTREQIAMTEAVKKFLKEEIAFCENSSAVGKAVQLF